jgi:hypothetical protein
MADLTNGMTATFSPPGVSRVKPDNSGDSISVVNSWRPVSYPNSSKRDTRYSAAADSSLVPLARGANSVESSVRYRKAAGPSFLDKDATVGSGKDVGVGSGVGVTGDVAGVAVLRETDWGETFSGAWVGKGKLVAAMVDKGDEATVGSGGDVGTVPEHADPIAATTTRINTGNRFFKIRVGLLN